MACVYKEYGGKIKMVQEQWLQLKMKILLDYTWKLIISVGNWTFGGGTFPGGAGMSKYMASGEGTPNPLYIYIGRN